MNGRYFWVSEAKKDPIFIQWIKIRNNEYAWTISPIRNKLGEDQFISSDDQYSPDLLHDWKIMKDGIWVNGKSDQPYIDKCKIDFLVQIKKA